MSKSKSDLNINVIEVHSPNEENETEKYVVLRDGFRVEDKEYSSPKDPIAIKTLDYWKKIATEHSYGEKTEIVKYDPKKHRVW